MQPLDIAVFHPIKAVWSTHYHNWRRENPHLPMNIATFMPLFMEVYAKGATPSNNMAGFRASGLYPWNVNAPNYTKCVKQCAASSLLTPKGKEDKGVQTDGR
jgi:hypothetical protein